MVKLMGFENLLIPTEVLQVLWDSYGYDATGEIQNAFKKLWKKGKLTKKEYESWCDLIAVELQD